MDKHIASVTFLVRDYDQAITYFTTALGFDLLEDKPQGEGKRWVLVAPGDGNQGASLLLAKSADERQAAAIGNQTGGRVAFFLHTDDFRRDHAAMLAKGVHFLEDPREEVYGIVAVFEDLYGNKWDLIENH